MGDAGLQASDVAPNLWVGGDVRIGEGVELGANVVIHSGTVLEDGVHVQDSVVLGKAVVRTRHSRAPDERHDPLVIGSGVTVCTGAVLFAGARVGRGR